MACALLYLPVLKAGFVYDDLWAIVHNPAIRSVAPASFLTDPETFAAAGSRLSTSNLRPLTVFSFALDYSAWKLSPSFYHAENVLWHLLNGWLAFLLIRRFFDRPPALLGTLIFLVHPAQVETVAWVTQRSNLLCAAASLASLLLLSGDRAPRGRAAAGLALYALALLAKEQALVLFGALALCDWALPSKRRWPEKLWLYVGIIGVTALYGLYRTGLGFPWALEPVKTRWDSNLYLAILSFALYIGKLLAPMNLRASYDYPSFDAWGIAAAAAVSLSYFALAAFVARRHKIAAAALLWIPTTLVTVLHLMPYQLYVAERFLYMPLIGAGLGCAWIYGRYAASRPALLVWTAALAAITATTVPNWRSETTVWAAAIAAEPTNAFSQMCYAASAPDADEAERHYKLALVNRPSESVRFAATNNLSWLFLKRGESRRALIWARAARALEPKNPAAIFNLARAHGALGDRRRAREALRELEALAPGSPMALELARQLR